MEDEERDLSSFNFLFDLWETRFKIISHEKLRFLLVFLTLPKNVGEDKAFLIFVLVFALLIEDREFLPNLLVGLYVAANDVVAVRYILEEIELGQLVNHCYFHQLRKDPNVEADFVLDPAPTFDFLRLTVQVVIA